MPVVHVARLLRLANRREPGDAPVRNLPMPLQKTQISTISFGHSLGTGRTGVRPAFRAVAPAQFFAPGRTANPSPLTFLSQQSFGYCPREVRAGDQSQDRQGARSRSATDAARARRRGDRISMDF